MCRGKKTPNAWLTSRNVALTVTKKVRKVKEEIVDLFPRPVFSSQIPPPPGAFPISGTGVG
jgi:hypothetical protein